jgi:hypothetical protein
VPPLAREVFDARLKIGGRRLPAAVVVPLAFIRNLLLGLLSGGDWVAPGYVLVTWRASGIEVGRIPAGSGYSEQLDVLEVVQRTLDELDEEEFLARWALGCSPRG